MNILLLLIFLKSAYADVKIKLGLIKLLEIRLDLCNEIKNIGIECPLKKGDLNIVTQIDIPAELPPGKYVVHVTATNFDGLSVACFDVDVKL